MAYAATSNVQDRNPYRKITASSEPSTSDVSDWIEEAEAELNGMLSSLGLTSPNVNANGILTLRNKVVTYVSGLVREAYAAAGGDGGNDDGVSAIDRWDAFLQDLVNNSIKWAGILEGGSAPASATKLRSVTTHNRDGLTVADGDFTPEYKKGDVL